MSGLVPTLRTDKNGRAQIRHLRADDGAAPAAGLPQPHLGPQVQPTPGSNEHLHALLTTAGYGYMGRRTAARALDTIREDDPGVPDLVAEMVSAATECARDEVLSRLDDLMEEVIKALDEDDRYDDSSGWTGYADDAPWPHGRSCLIRAYHVGCVRAETEAAGDAIERLNLVHEVDRLDSLLRSDSPTYLSEPLNLDKDAARCRGLAAYCLAEIGGKGPTGRAIGQEEASRVEIFAAWAGQQEDIAEVIVAAKQAGSADPATVDRLIRERRTIEPALREGTL